MTKRNVKEGEKRIQKSSPLSGSVPKFHGNPSSSFCVIPLKNKQSVIRTTQNGRRHRWKKNILHLFDLIYYIIQMVWLQF